MGIYYLHVSVRQLTYWMIFATGSVNSYGYSIFVHGLWYTEQTVKPPLFRSPINFLSFSTGGANSGYSLFVLQLRGKFLR
jgi:hypothetical protein